MISKIKLKPQAAISLGVSNNILIHFINLEKLSSNLLIVYILYSKSEAVLILDYHSFIRLESNLINMNNNIVNPQSPEPP